MGGGHHYHPDEFKLPDWKIYKVEDCPQLLKNQEQLAKIGLKDPWARNEVWRFKVNKGMSRWGIMREVALKGCKTGFALALVTTGVEMYIRSKHDHHGGEGGEHGGGHH